MLWGIVSQRMNQGPLPSEAPETLTPFQIYWIGMSTDWGLQIDSLSKHLRLFLGTLNSETHCSDCAWPYQTLCQLNHIAFLMSLGWSQLLPWGNGMWGVEMVIPRSQCAWNSAGLGGLPQFVYHKAREYHTPGIWKSAKEQQTNPGRPVGMYLR